MLTQVRVGGFEPPCDQLPFQHVISVRGYTRPWWRRRDSNARPPPCKGGALPTELHPQGQSILQLHETALTAIVHAAFVFANIRPQVFVTLNATISLLWCPQPPLGTGFVLGWEFGRFIPSGAAVFAFNLAVSRARLMPRQVSCRLPGGPRVCCYSAPVAGISEAAFTVPAVVPLHHSVMSVRCTPAPAPYVARG